MHSQGLHFGEFFLPDPSGPLLRGEQAIKLQPKTTALLWLLLQRAGEVVTKAELFESLWPNQDVGEEALSFQIRKLRQALGDDSHDPQFILTIHRLGFRFLAPVEERHRDPTDAALVGREDEHRRLQAEISRLGTGPQRWVFISGESGIGKSTLMDRFARDISGAALVGRGNAYAHQQAQEPYAVLLEALASLLRDPRGAAYTEPLKECAPNWLRRLPGLLSREELNALQEQAGQPSASRMQREWQALLETICAEHPVALTLDDMHWCDKSSMDLLTASAQSHPELPLLLVAGYRHGDANLAQHPIVEFRQQRLAAGQAIELPLGRLSRKEVQDYLDANLQGTQVNGPLLARVFERSEGHPLYLAQLIAALNEREKDTDAGSEIVMAGVPDGLRELIGAKVDQLDRSAQRLLEHASVIGPVFAVPVLADLLRRPPADIEADCRALAASERFIQPADLEVWPDGTIAAKFGFRHDLYREVLRLRLPQAELSSISQGIATRLEQAYGNRANELATRLAEYYSQAAEYEKAHDYQIRAAYQALASGAFDEARECSTRAQDCAQFLQGRLRHRAELAQAAVDMHIGINQGGFGATDLELQTARLRLLLPRVEDTRVRENVLGLLWMTSFFQSHHQEAMEYARRAQELGHDIPQPALECAGLAWRALGAHVTGRDREALDLSQQAIELADQHDWDASTMAHAEPGCAAISSNAMMNWVLGRPDTALARAFEGVARAEMLQNPYLYCTTVGTTLGSIHLLRRDAQKLLDNCQQIRPQCERYEHGEALAWITKFEGFAHCLQGRHEQGLPMVQAIMQAQRESGSLVSLAADYVHLAEQLLASGATEDVAEAIEEGFEVLRQTGEKQWESELWRVHGDYYRHCGDSASAAEHYEQALALAEARGANSYALRAAIGLARLEPGSADVYPDDNPLRRCYERFSEGFDTADLLEARSLLAQSGREPVA